MSMDGLQAVSKGHTRHSCKRWCWCWCWRSCHSRRGAASGRRVAALLLRLPNPRASGPCWTTHWTAAAICAFEAAESARQRARALSRLKGCGVADCCCDTNRHCKNRIPDQGELRDKQREPCCAFMLRRAVVRRTPPPSPITVSVILRSAHLASPPAPLRARVRDSDRRCV